MHTAVHRWQVMSAHFSLTTGLLSSLQQTVASTLAHTHHFLGMPALMHRATTTATASHVGLGTSALQVGPGWVWQQPAARVAQQAQAGAFHFLLAF
jgi:hypothetical protein